MRKKERYPLSPLLFSLVLEGLLSVTGQEKEEHAGGKTRSGTVYFLPRQHDDLGRKSYRTYKKASEFSELGEHDDILIPVMFLYPSGGHMQTLQLKYNSAYNHSSTHRAVSLTEYV